MVTEAGFACGRLWGKAGAQTRSGRLGGMGTTGFAVAHLTPGNDEEVSGKTPFPMGKTT
jgi:hypothetical protein